MASKFRQYIEDLIYGYEPEPEKAQDQAPEQEPEKEQAQEKEQDRDWLDEEVERQKAQEMPDAAYAVSERDEPATGEITPGQSDVEHDGLQQDGSMDRDTMSDGLDQGGMDEIEM